MQHLTDKQIEQTYQNYNIVSIEFKSSRKSGYIELEFPNGNPEFSQDRVDNFIIYDSGKIAFNYWYPESIYLELCAIIKNSAKYNEKKILSRSFNYYKKSKLS